MKVLYHEQKETVAQSGSDRVFLGSQRHTSLSFSQSFDLHGQKILMRLSPEPEILSAPKARCVLHDMISEFRKVGLN
jgi:hypothetical protein